MRLGVTRLYLFKSNHVLKMVLFEVWRISCDEISNYLSFSLTSESTDFSLYRKLILFVDISCWWLCFKFISSIPKFHILPYGWKCPVISHLCMQHEQNVEFIISHFLGFMHYINCYIFFTYKKATLKMNFIFCCKPFIF